MADPWERSIFVRWPDRIREEAVEAAMSEYEAARSVATTAPSSSNVADQPPYTSHGLVEAILAQRPPSGARVERSEGGLHRALALHKAGALTKADFLAEVKRTAPWKARLTKMPAQRMLQSRILMSLHSPIPCMDLGQLSCFTKNACFGSKTYFSR